MNRLGKEQERNLSWVEDPSSSKNTDSSFGTLSTPSTLDPVAATQAIREQLCQLIGVDRFELWFSNPTCLLVGTDRVSIFAESDFERQRIQNSFGVELRDVVNATCGPDYQLTFEIAAKASTPSVEPSTAQQRVDEQAAPATETNKKRAPRKPGLNQFCFGESNRLAETASEQTLRHPGQFSPLLIYGPTGSGKTLLLDCMVTEFRKRLNMGRCVMITAEQFTSNFVHSLRGAGLPMFRRKYRDLDLLAIDDIHFLSGKHATMVEMQYTIDHLIRAGKQVIVSSDRPPMELSQLGMELCARLTGGLICPLQYPCEDSRYEILKRMCREREFQIPSATLRFVASKVSRDVRRLSGAINRIQADSICNGRKITVEYAAEILGDLISITTTAASMAQIERAVCDFCGVTSSELKSVSRAKRVSAARMLAMWLSREYTSNAYSEIGQFFGGRTHSTVIAAGKRVKGWISQNHRIDLPNAQCSTRDAIERIESKLRITG
ncbi:DnaA/Hda family protein [bacterium]|nr:DnaA/Hda family protein [bacterium]